MFSRHISRGILNKKYFAFAFKLRRKVKGSSKCSKTSAQSTRSNDEVEAIISEQKKLISGLSFFAISIASELILGLDIFLGTTEANFSRLDGDWYVGTTKDTPVDIERWDLVSSLLARPSGIRSIAQLPNLWASSGIPSAMGLPYGVTSESTMFRIVYETELEGVYAITSVSYLIGDKTSDGAGYYAAMDPYPSMLFIDKIWVETIEGLVSDLPL